MEIERVVMKLKNKTLIYSERKKNRKMKVIKRITWKEFLNFKN